MEFPQESVVSTVKNRMELFQESDGVLSAEMGEYGEKSDGALSGVGWSSVRSGMELCRESDGILSGVGWSSVGSRMEFCRESDGALSGPMKYKRTHFSAVD
ncbi:uncharacterized [Tachysurus ichikawai]